MRDYKPPSTFIAKVTSPAGRSVKYVQTVRARVTFTKDPKEAMPITRRQLKFVRMRTGDSKITKLHPDFFRPAVANIDEMVRKACSPVQSDLFEGEE